MGHFKKLDIIRLNLEDKVVSFCPSCLSEEMPAIEGPCPTCGHEKMINDIEEFDMWYREFVNKTGI